MIIYDITHREIKVSNFVYLDFFVYQKNRHEVQLLGQLRFFMRAWRITPNEEQPTVRAEKKERRSWRRPFFCVIRISKSGIIDFFDFLRSQKKTIQIVFEVSLRE